MKLPKKWRVMTTLWFSLLFGSIGVGYFIYGKKQRKVVPWIAGIGLCVIPYLVSGPTAMAVTGTLLTVTPWFLKD